jgi:hypothetical protein
MADAIATAIRRKLAGEPRPALSAEAIARFERRHLTAELAALFDRVVAVRPLTVAAGAPRVRTSA